jgi:hypothetical protein
MNYKFAAYPSMYNGTEFRSRLEARWAARSKPGEGPHGTAITF